MSRGITKTRIISKKRAVKKSTKVQLPVRIRKQKTDPPTLKLWRARSRKQTAKDGKTESAKGQKQENKIVESIKDVEKDKEQAVKKIKQQEKKIKKQPKVIKPSFAKATVVRRHSFERRSAGKQVDPEKIEQDKRLMMWAGVAFFMVLIFGVWIFNLKNVFKTTENINTNNSAVQEWDKIADEFTKTLEKVKEGMAELKEVETEEEGRDIFSEIATSTDDAVISEDDEIEELKKRLKELENQIKADEEQATSAPSTQL